MARPPQTPPRLPARVRGKGGKPIFRSPGVPRKPPRPRPPKRAAKITPEQVAAAFVRPVRPVNASTGYQAAALAAAVVVMLLPVAYLALIAGVGWAMYYHFAEHAWLLEIGGERGRGRGRAFLAFLYVLPGLIGGAVILALLKPLASFDGGREQWRVLHRPAQPTLFALIDRVCDAVGAPRPDQVRVDPQVNMSAGSLGGFLGLFGGRFVLTIGVPLAAGMSAAGFAGVLAHEFGHFAQRGGRGVSGAVLAVQSWLARAAFKRDRLDELIEEGSTTLGWLMIPCWLCGICLWLARRALIGLLHLSQAAVSALSRQMEFDADRYYTRLVGPTVFADSSRRIFELNAGFDGALHELLPALAGGAPPEDLPALCVHHAPRLTEDQAVEADEARRADAGFWDTLFSSHPPTVRRLAAARREGERVLAAGGPGVELDGPAMNLFGDFPALCRDVTLDFYRSMLGGRPEPQDLAPVRPLPPDPHRPSRPTQDSAASGRAAKGRGAKGRGAKSNGRSARGAAAEGPEAFDDRPARLLPYARAYVEAPADAAAHQADLIARREHAAAAADRLRPALAKLDKITERRVKTFDRLAAAGLTGAGGAGGDRYALQEKFDQLERARDAAERAVAKLERAPAAARLAALDLYAAPGVAGKLPGYVREGVEELLMFVQILRDARPLTRGVHDAAVRLSAALRVASGGSMFRGVRFEAEERLAALATAWEEVDDRLRGLSDPFAVPLEVTRKPDPDARPFDARLPTATIHDGPALLLSAAARGLRELGAAADHADRVLAARADWIVARLKLDGERPAPRRPGGA